MRISEAEKARLRRLAEGLQPHGPQLLQALTTDDAVHNLSTFAYAGLPPVTVVSSLLPAELRSALTEDRVRRFIGALVAAVLRAEGFTVLRSGVRVPGEEPFVTGAIYEKLPKEPSLRAVEKSDALLDAMIAGLTAAQRSALVARIQGYRS